MDVYWAVYYPPGAGAENFLSATAPISLYKDLLKDKNESNRHDNFLNCPAFLKSVKNTFIVQNNIAANININRRERKFYPLDANSTGISEYYQFKSNSRHNFDTINYYLNYIFFAESELVVRTLPAYMHKSEFQTKCNYVPGAFDVSKWFRPVEGAIELNPVEDELHINKGDPLYYIEFNTEETINLKKFFMTHEIWEIAQSCIKYKKFEPGRPLKSLYEVFQQSKIRSRLLQQIQNNLL